MYNTGSNGCQGGPSVVEEVVLRMTPQEAHLWFNHKVESVSGALDTLMDNPPLYIVSGQCCVQTKGHIHSS